jgi:DNA-binding response OmpR family regulator
MTSAQISVDVRAFSLEAGANVFLAKPYGLDHLVAVAEKLVSSVMVRP